MSHASSSSLKRKIKRNSKKRNIKSRKIDKRERKILVSKRFITPEWLASAEFTVNNKVYTATKVSPFMANYGRELRMVGT